ncbi:MULTISPECIES: DUF4430 domain-containing protein [Allobacillus]|uniref:DUF4430 domain-containing protein n=1 Tax=Allobacillus salarius TaxID=1955272 RepID=A0A556PRW1_9BACI|nr:DUF4430 domain-containing protein [Allobacillus salarius]TSJ67126.1 DUF4430 domain-containing protein [Allobacillus salarius]
MQLSYKRLFILLSIAMLFLLAACGSAPLSKEEANELKEAEEQSQVKEVTFHEKINDEFETNLTKSGIGKEANSDKSSEENENNESNSAESTKVASDPESKEASLSDAKEEKSVSHDDQSNKVTSQASKDKTKSESTTKKSSKSDNQKSDKKQEKKQASEKPSTPSQSSKDKVKDKEKQSTDSSENNQENQQKDDQPSDENKEEEDAKKAQTIVHSIVISDSEIPLPPTEMEINDGFTVLDALIKITKAKKIQMDYRGGQGATAYVEGIANVYEFDRGSGSGWMYRVNGIFPDRGAGVVPLLPGDRVEWLYTTNLGKDLGADLKPFRR